MYELCVIPYTKIKTNNYFVNRELFLKTVAARARLFKKNKKRIFRNNLVL